MNEEQEIKKKRRLKERKQEKGRKRKQMLSSQKGLARYGMYGMVMTVGYQTTRLNREEHKRTREHWITPKSIWLNQLYYYRPGT